MLVALAFPAHAGDQPLYERALGLIDEHYLRAQEIGRAQMFSEAGRQLEARIEWLLVEQDGARLVLRDGNGTWTDEVELLREQDLAAALADLEDAVRGSGLTIDPE